eukprot:m.1067731 g.1067731  ORF g.1067731 m.1067731 type:complete len:832 (-) comp24223_c1_seq7:1321-3816(-)
MDDWGGDSGGFAQVVQIDTAPAKSRPTQRDPEGGKDRGGGGRNTGAQRDPAKAAPAAAASRPVRAQASRDPTRAKPAGTAVSRRERALAQATEEKGSRQRNTPARDAQAGSGKRSQGSAQPSTASNPVPSDGGDKSSRPRTKTNWPEKDNKGKSDKKVQLQLVPNAVFDESKSKSLKAGGLQMVPNAVFESSKGQNTDVETDDFADQGGGGIKVIKLDPPHRPRKGRRTDDDTRVRRSPTKDRFQKVEKRMSMWFGLSDPYAGQNAFMEIRDPKDAKKEQEEKQEQKRKEEERRAELLKLRQVFGEENGMTEYHRFIQKEKKYKKSMGGNSLATLAAKRKPSVGTATINKVSEETMIRAELLSLPEFSPLFINFITFVQFVVLAGTLILAFQEDDIAKWGLNAKPSNCDGDGDGSCPAFFNGSADANGVTYEQVNPWIGPSTDFLIKFNCKFSPCMRTDTAIERSLFRQAQQECCVGCDASSSTIAFQEICDSAGKEGFSCCALGIATPVADRRIISAVQVEQFQATATAAGMTDFNTCADNNGMWLQPNGIGIECVESPIVVLRPCCNGVKSQCDLLTASQCAFEGGHWHSTKQLCSQVACMQETCTTYTGIKPAVQDKPAQNQVANPNQWFRFIAPLFIHSGGIHFFLVAIVQLYIGRPIERSIGWLRMGLIYSISGVGGYLVSGVLDPYVVSCGANPAVFGLIAIMLVELIQSWKVVPSPKTQLAKLLAYIVVGFIIGSLPFIDNFSQLGGFSFGLVASIIFLPYVTFTKWARRGRKILLALCMPLLLVMIVVGIVLFYTVQNTDFCTWCDDFNCWSWSSDIACDGTE